MKGETAMKYKTQLNNGQVFYSPNVSTDTALNIFVENAEQSMINSIIEILTPENLSSINVYSSVTETQDILVKHYGLKKYTGTYTCSVTPAGIILSFELQEYSSLEARVAALEELLKNTKGVD